MATQNLTPEEEYNVLYTCSIAIDQQVATLRAALDQARKTGDTGNASVLEKLIADAHIRQARANQRVVDWILSHHGA